MTRLPILTLALLGALASVGCTGNRGGGGGADAGADPDAGTTPDSGTTADTDAMLDGGPDMDSGPGTCPAGPVWDAAMPPGAGCNVVTQTGCDPGLGCYPWGAGILACVPAGTGCQDEVCVNGNDCTPAYLCLGTAMPLRCSQICNPASVNTCPSGHRCVAVPGFPGVGACIP